MRTKLIIAIMLVAFMAMPAFASVQNIKVSGDIENVFLVRDQLDLGDDTSNTNIEQFYQNLLITQTRLRVDADLTDNVSATIGLINEHVWDMESATNTDVNLDLAYVTIREMLYSPLTVQIGRQVFSYGNSFIINSGASREGTVSRYADTLSGVAIDLTKKQSMDAIRMILDYEPLTIELLAAKPGSSTVAANGSPFDDDDIDLFGINANYPLGDDKNTVVEAYFFAKIDKRWKEEVAGAGMQGLEPDTVYCPGLRASTNPIAGLNVQAEVAWQGGNKSTTNIAGTARNDNAKRKAMAAQVISSYLLPFEKTAEYIPVVIGGYTYLSGDSNPWDANTHFSRASQEKYTAWDPMYISQGQGSLITALFPSSNCHVYTAAIQTIPIEDITSKLSWTGVWLDKENNTMVGTVETGMSNTAFPLLQPDGTLLTPRVTSNKFIGYEVEAKLTYDYTEDVQMGLTAGWFFAGDMFDSANDNTAKQFLANVGVAF